MVSCSEGVDRVYHALRGLLPFLDTPDAVQTSQAPARRVLIADDNESNLLLLTVSLRKLDTQYAL